MDVELKRLKRSDLLVAGQFVPREVEVEGLTGWRNGRIVGFAGVQKFDRHHWAFFNALDPIVIRPFFLHRLVKEVLAAYARVGIGPIYSLANDGPGPKRWHEVLGFRPVRDEERDDEIKRCEEALHRGAWVK